MGPDIGAPVVYGDAVFVGDDQVVAVYPVRNMKAAPSLKARDAALADPFAIRLAGMATATGRLTQAGDVSMSTRGRFEIALARQDGIALLVDDPGRLVLLNSELQVTGQKRLPKLPADPFTWWRAVRPAGGSKMFVWLYHLSDPQNQPRKTGPWLLLDVPSLRVAERWDADWNLWPVGFTKDQLLVTSDERRGPNRETASYLESLGSPRQVTLLGLLAGNSTFAADGSLVYRMDVQKGYVTQHSLNAVINGKVTTLRDDVDCGNCVWAWAAAASTPRVAALMEPGQSSWSFDPDTWTTVKGVFIVDLGPPISMQELPIADGGQIKNATNVALSPDGRHLAILAGGELSMFTLPPIGSGAPLVPPKSKK